MERYFDEKGHHWRLKWSSSDISYLKKHYPTGIVEDIADHLGTTSPTVRKKAKELGLEHDRLHCNTWRNRWVKNYKHKGYEWAKSLDESGRRPTVCPSAEGSCSAPLR